MLKNKVGELTLSTLKNYCKAIVIKTVEYWQKDRHNQWKRIESSEVSSSIYDQMIFDEDTETIQWGKYCPFKK